MLHVTIAPPAVPGEQLRQHFAAMQSVFLAGLLDSHHSVRLAALRAVAALVSWMGTPEEVALFRELVPAVIQVRLRGESI